jgi:transposase-like protein
MSVKRRNHSPEFKFRTALEAAKEQKTISQLASELNLHPNQISNWKKHLSGDTPETPNPKQNANNE